MIENISLPQDLMVTIGSERKDFAVKAKREKPLNESFFLIIIGTIWLTITSVFSEEIIFTSNGFPTIADFENLGLSTLFIVIFLLIGIGMLGFGIYFLFRKGGYFVGTPTRLVNYQKGKIRSIDWKQFTGDIKVSGDAQKGNISLQMRTGRMSGEYSNRYVPDVIHMLGIPNAFEIGQSCRKRIKENTLTPSTILEDNNNPMIREVPAGKDREIALTHMESRKNSRSENIVLMFLAFGIVVYSFYVGKLLWVIIAAIMILWAARRRQKQFMPKGGRNGGDGD